MKRDLPPDTPQTEDDESHLGFAVLYEDNHLLALNKPAGLLTQPTDKVNDSLETRAKSWIKKRDAKQGNVFLHALHRLDRHASGIILFAKTQKALSRVSSALRNNEVYKEYVALVHAPEAPLCGTLVDFLVHANHRADVVAPSHAEAKRAELTILSCEQHDTHQWRVRIRLITGRYHQIRAQLSHHGFPIIGDEKYGSSLPFGKDAIALHHSKLSLIHPTRQTEVHISSLPPF